MKNFKIFALLVVSIFVIGMSAKATCPGPEWTSVTTSAIPLSLHNPERTCSVQIVYCYKLDPVTMKYIFFVSEFIFPVQGCTATLQEMAATDIQEIIHIAMIEDFLTDPNHNLGIPVCGPTGVPPTTMLYQTWNSGCFQKYITDQGILGYRWCGFIKCQAGYSACWDISQNPPRLVYQRVTQIIQSGSCPNPTNPPDLEVLCEEFPCPTF